MFDGAVTVSVPDLHAEAVVGALAVLELDLGEHLFVALRLEDGLGDQALIPEGQIVGGHGELTGSKHPASALLRGNAQWAESVTIVGCGVGLGELRFV